METDGGGWTLVWQMHHNDNHGNDGPAGSSLEDCGFDPAASSSSGLECNIPEKWTLFEPTDIRLVSYDFGLSPALSFDWIYSEPTSELDSGNNILPYTSSSHFSAVEDNCSDSSIPPTTDTVNTDGYWMDKASPGSSGNWDVDLDDARYDANCNRTYDGSGGYGSATTLLYVR